MSASPRCPATIPEHPDEDEELWIDGPRSNARLVAAESISEASPAGFLGRFAALPSTTAVGSTSKNLVASQSELWVDGPAEFQTRLPNSRYGSFFDLWPRAGSAT